MTCRLFVAFKDGFEAEEEIPNHELADTQRMCEETSKDLYVAIELEDSNQTLIYHYKKETTYAY